MDVYKYRINSMFIAIWLVILENQRQTNCPQIRNWLNKLQENHRKKDPQKTLKMTWVQDCKKLSQSVINEKSRLQKSMYIVFHVLPEEYQVNC